jgi:hypothetical protein
VLGEVEQAEKLAVEAIDMARELDHSFTLAFVLASLSWLYSTFRNDSRTLELADEAIAVSTQYSFELILAWAKASQGWALAVNGQEQGLESLVSALLGLQVQVSTILLHRLCLRKYTCEKVALSKAWLLYRML